MGQKLKTIFDYVEKEGGKMAVLRVTLTSKIPQPTAENISDTEDNIQRLRDAAKKVLGKENIPV
jgi:hypothetical protein